MLAAASLSHKLSSRLPSSFSQPVIEETIGHWRGRRCGDGQSLVDCFQDKTTVEAPGEGAEVARQMFGAKARWVAKRLFLTLASTVLTQRKAGCRAAVRQSR